MKIQNIYSFYLLIIISFFSSCTKENLTVDVPPCIEKEIKELKNKAVSNPPAQVWKWEIDETDYFYITSGCCDTYNYLYDENCNKVCAPDGGITGKGDGSCPEYDDNTIKTLVWEDNRN